jgi:hypothetical protein
MLRQTKDFVDVAARARELGCRFPLGIALLPGNFSTAAHAGEFCYHAATPHVRSAWQSVGLFDEGPEARDMKPDHAEDTGCDAPSAQVPLAVFFGAALHAGPEWCLAVALGMVSTVLAFHPGCASPRETRCDVVVERPGSGYACLEYQGDAFGLIALAREVQEIWVGRRGA